ncbi:MAG TPA: glycoside hydrolase family 25 protein [Thermoanaerobaculia bacterium]|nr:glycoside hydrolase family 25 protein [Thermoanaerobaculia bacterium]
MLTTTINFRVVDLFHLDTVNSFSDAAAAGLWGVIHKATTGATGTDPAYAQRRQPALDAGLLWGAYHFGTNADVTQQVDNFLTTAAPDATTLVALDFEPYSGDQMTLAQARQFLALLGQKLGRLPVLYSGGLIKQDLGSTVDTFFGSHRLWLADYSPAPSVQASWSNYWLWQYTDSTTGLTPNSINGIPGDTNGELDCNSYVGTRQQLAQEWAS